MDSPPGWLGLGAVDAFGREERKPEERLLVTSRGGTYVYVDLSIKCALIIINLE